MDLAQHISIYTEDDYYNTPNDVRCELIDGQLIYAQAAPAGFIKQYSWSFH